MKRQVWFSLLAGVILSVAALPAFAEFQGHLWLKGQKTGEVRGSVTQRGREGSIAVIAVSHEIVSPRDPASGLPTGKRMHKPISITKEIDKASPLLYNMMVNNETISSFTLRFYMAGTTGAETQYFTIELTNATISSINMRMYDIRKPELANIRAREEISFTYQKITWRWMDGGIMAEDDWESPVAWNMTAPTRSMLFMDQVALPAKRG